MDLEHVGARAAGSDLAYLFAVAGDLRWTAGWAPTADEPVPYLSLDVRRAFAAAYLHGCGAADAVDDFLFEVERCALRERARLMCVWLLLCGGDPGGMMAGAASMYLPHLAAARVALTAAEGGDADARADVVERGAVVVGAAAVAAAAAAAATADAVLAADSEVST